MLNIVLGWSLVFWVVALIWSLSNKGQNQVTNVTVVQTNGGSKAE
ncbi:putative superinfection immunity protein [Escherichia phage PGN829.1]|uniref:Putative superinfection immunity protein n=1 Tax=Escherichia phage PGN829.1 TaxID=2315696 RepID=A0A385II96_9CAUD|nr:immunity to superinfection [Escherichia phage PGN829.1]AXY82544.1 putative superinfection immunity protein [Escherichia phage PGN829.1]